MGRVLGNDELLSRVPQQEPFRFVDELVEVRDDGAVGRYTWRKDADFYRGHFPGNPVTPGVLLVESMAQCGLVPMAMRFFYRDYEDARADRIQTLFTDASVEFSGIVRPGDTVTTESRLLFFRRHKVKVAAVMTLADGSEVCRGELAGLGVIG